MTEPKRHAADVGARHLARSDGNVGLLGLKCVEESPEILRLVVQVGIHGDDNVGVIRPHRSPAGTRPEPSPLCGLDDGEWRRSLDFAEPPKPVRRAVGPLHQPDEFEACVGQGLQRAAKSLVEPLDIGGLVQGRNDDRSVPLRGVRQSRLHSAGAGSPLG